MIAANYVFTVAKPDGLTLGWIAPTLYFDQFVGRKEVIGSPPESEHLYMRSDSPYKPSKMSVMPANHRNAVPAAPPKPGLFSQTIGRNRGSEFTIVLGY